jgi:hypothetical protein
VALAVAVVPVAVALAAAALVAAVMAAAVVTAVVAVAAPAVVVVTAAVVAAPAVAVTAVVAVAAPAVAVTETLLTPAQNKSGGASAHRFFVCWPLKKMQGRSQVCLAFSGGGRSGGAQSAKASVFLRTQHRHISEKQS